jgi:hypothetical protein
MKQPIHHQESKSRALVNSEAGRTHRQIESIMIKPSSQSYLENKELPWIVDP